MKPPRLAIVTSLCKGYTLYTTLHLRKDKFPMNKSTLIAQQIAQGMGYLHHRGIVHKDLKTKNIFLENGRAWRSGDHEPKPVASSGPPSHTCGGRTFDPVPLPESRCHWLRHSIPLISSKANLLTTV